MIEKSNQGIQVISKIKLLPDYVNRMTIKWASNNNFTVKETAPSGVMIPLKSDRLIFLYLKCIPFIEMEFNTIFITMFTSE